ncbi:maleylpyruvate isomerase family mycothiol-dependent enzyme [Saccharopolyspora erythraea]|uniref:maleylpyruvate isomerase family mycothiol-dependent enzyme n=1 Tax=Saccharopolyspora erythraea TaxID=1836 RepID=UPI001BAA4952|nr:maleylpyruvate isomerase family mycothiol-dependent enzyme [Saccharopolyspora erythraea]QUH04387.1 maleylpyruvate isomerase family mycothiol-dependent enzyme [Saccharopolyspora erythraea]
MADIALGAGDRSNIESTTGAAQLAHRTSVALAAIEQASDRFMETARSLDELSIHRPSLLPGWTRAHVISHVARNADGFLNLLRWARTGVEHPMYASASDRDADIDEGAVRGRQLLLEDLAASCERFARAARELPVWAWTAEVLDGAGDPIPAHGVLRGRLLEVWVHLVDLDHGFGFDDIPRPDVEEVLEDVVQQFGGRHDVPALTVVVDFDGRERSWELRGTTSRPSQVHGDPGAMLGWLLGRTSGERLTGDPLPTLPPWL